MAEKSPDRSASSSRSAEVPLTTPPSNHGRTVAAWTTTAVVLVGALIAALALVFAQAWLFWVGLGVCVLGVVVGKVLQLLGHGQPGIAPAGTGPTSSTR